MSQRKQNIDPQVAAEKNKRVAVGATAAGVLLLVFLVIVLVILFVQIGVKKAEIRRLEAKQAEFAKLVEDGEKDLEYFETENGLYDLALQKGWK